MPIADNLVAQADVNTRGRTDDAPYDHANSVLGVNFNAPVVEAGDGGQVGMRYDSASSQYSNIGTLTSSLLESPFTMAVRATAITWSPDRYFYAINNESSNGFGLATATLQPDFKFWASAQAIGTVAGWTLGTELVLVGTVDAGRNMRLYANGTEIAGPLAETTGTVSPATQQWGTILGGFYSNSRVMWSAFWDRILTQSEIDTELMASENPFLPTTSNQVLFDVDINTMIAGNLKFGTSSQLRAEFGAGAFRGLQFSEDFDA